MRHLAPIAVLAVAALSAGIAFAKAPRPADTPSVEEIYQAAKKASEDKAAAAADAAKDPIAEEIQRYLDPKKSERSDYQKLVDIINDAKTEKLQSYRIAASQAIIERFSREREDDVAVRASRREIASKLLELMKAPAKDDVGLRAIENILFAWWKPQMLMDIKFKANDKLQNRQEAYKRMKKFLGKEN